MFFVPKFTCSACGQQYTPQQNPDGSYALGLCPYCPQEHASDAWNELVQQQRLERERRRKR